ncbi:hypothetical protein SARC_00480 [Sphaeroforma arctica JP610]|uniref:Thioredoxin domain-containing protein n=1 Tax=Sphaeroforma arctica JP610 TaxID=667725 RepID=A0A0L0GGE2_9EUKA|nr:hypothetical protein SARC_00480 [Sphaeroforma arctica JP610]KNC87388.1 hypothetical protein SARC_00480 [Sphaeroforma arctica JP610]|eukprot:XP_014161290.1 hypothetical protein SARC_00480 [Sphaeroforma arctica JP610]
MSRRIAAFAAIGVVGTCVGAYVLQSTQQSSPSEPKKKGLPVSQLPSDMSKYDPDDPMVQLALKLREEGAVLYTTDWCGPCKRQKDAFGDAQDLLPQVDCSRMDGRRGFKPECLKLGIRTVPSWKRSDGSFIPGDPNLNKLQKNMLSSSTNFQLH